MTLSWGPQSLLHTQRLTIAHEIAERLKERFHPEVLAIGLYGSQACQFFRRLSEQGFLVYSWNVAPV